jgi:hypothetical protein
MRQWMQRFTALYLPPEKGVRPSGTSTWGVPRDVDRPRRPSSVQTRRGAAAGSLSTYGLALSLSMHSVFCAPHGAPPPPLC